LSKLQKLAAALRHHLAHLEAEQVRGGGAPALGLLLWLLLLLWPGVRLAHLQGVCLRVEGSGLCGLLPHGPAAALTWVLRSPSSPSSQVALFLNELLFHLQQSWGLDLGIQLGVVDSGPLAQLPEVPEVLQQQQQQQQQQAEAEAGQPGQPAAEPVGAAAAGAGTGPGVGAAEPVQRWAAEQGGGLEAQGGGAAAVAPASGAAEGARGG
jgi:hypothetical protein